MIEYLEPDSDLPYFYGQRVANERETVFGYILGHNHHPFTITVAWDGGGFGTYNPDELIFYPPQKDEPQKELRRSEQPDFYNEPDPDNPPEETCFSYGSNNGCDEYCPLLRAGKCEHQNDENAELYAKAKELYNEKK